MKHQMPRWEFPEDRFEFARWRESRRPAKHLDWRWDGRKLTLMIEPKHARRWFDINADDLHLFRGGWRNLVAMAIKRCRRDIRHNVKRMHHYPRGRKTHAGLIIELAGNRLKQSGG